MKKAIEEGLRVELASAAKRRADASADLRFAVLRASTWGLSQREIASILGVSQPAVSQMLGTVRRTSLGHGPIGRHVLEYRDDIVRIAREHGASRLRVFGSVARGEDTEGSDLDLLVDMRAGTGMLAIARLGDDLSDLLGVPVDIVPEHQVKAEALEALLASAVVL
jgi:predicted nucleotidyltransferase